MKKIYVGNLPWSASEADLNELFSSFGTVHSAAVISDRDTGRSRGFGFVEMDEDAADKAIAGIDGRELDGRALRVNEAQDKRQSSRGRW